MRRAVALICLLGLVFASVADAKQPGVKVGKVAVTTPVAGRSALLVPVSYPIAFKGRQLRVEVAIYGGVQSPVHHWLLRPRANAGSANLVDRRGRFTYIHRVDLSHKLSAELGRWRVTVEAGGLLDVNHDGKPEMSSGASAGQILPVAGSGPRLCSTVPQLLAKPGRRVSVKLPVCTSGAGSKVISGPRHGSVSIATGQLTYRSATKFHGTDSLRLNGGVPVVIKVGTAQKAVVRAIGDSVTAGFGYYDDGSLMKLTSLFSCRPGKTFFNDACSSNSASTSNVGTKVEYAPDYGLANNVSWAAQWSNNHGITDYENLAVSGSTPADWLPGGQLYKTLQKAEAEDPDYILMTMGANPILTETLFGVDQMGCAIWADLFGKYRECIEEAFARVHLHEHLESLYKELVAETSATIYLMQYHLAIPSSALAYTATQIAEMAEVMNTEIATIAAAVNPKRLQMVTPPHFNVGIDISPVYPSKRSCSRLGYKVDGPSVQNDATQDELEVLHPLSFCSGPVTGPPWVISGDTGVHPSAAGYAQMASQVPAPE